MNLTSSSRASASCARARRRERPRGTYEFSSARVEERASVGRRHDVVVARGGLPARRPRLRGTPRSPRQPRCPTRPRQRFECCACRTTRRLSCSSPPRPSPPPRRASGADRRRESCRCHCCQTHPSHACPWCAALRAHRNNGRCRRSCTGKNAAARVPVQRASKTRAVHGSGTCSQW